MNDTPRPEPTLVIDPSGPPDPPKPLPARVRAEDLNVAPGVLGMPLATPLRRLAAMGIDLLAIALLSWLGSVWLLAAGGALLAEAAWARRKGASRRRRWAAWAVAAVLAGLAVQRAAQAPPRSAAEVQAEADEPDDADNARLKALQQQVTALRAELQAVRASASAAAASAPGGAAASSAPSAASAPAPTAAQPQRLRDRIAHGLDELGLGYGWSVVYFSLLPAWWRGQTLGKRLLRLRVLELTGKPMTAMRCLRRYGGYVAGMATGGLGLAQVVWDSNRQGLQDKAAHTVVVDERLPLS